MDQMQQAFYLIALAVFGLIFGSFANVVIWRLPRGESLSEPGSRCPACGHAIRATDNIPVVSWLLLRGRCRDCGEPISLRYPTIELMSAGLWVLAGAVYGLSGRAAAAVCLFYLLMVLSAIDLDTMRLPNRLVGVVAVIGLAGAVVTQVTGAPAVPLVGPAGSGWLSQPLVYAAAGGLIGTLVTVAVSVSYGVARGRAGMGMGDFKLIAAGGLFLGPLVLLALLLGSFFGVVGGGVLAARSGGGPLGQRRIPFGPFLAAGIVVAAVAGPAIAGWYLRLAWLR